MGKIFSEIDKEIARRTKQSYEEGLQATKEDIESFYDAPAGKYYKRTHTYDNSPDGEEPSGSDGNYEYKIFLNVPPSYPTGSFTGQEVFEAAQVNGAGILGKGGTWFASMYDIEEAIKKNFS